MKAHDSDGTIEEQLKELFGEIEDMFDEPTKRAQEILDGKIELDIPSHQTVLTEKSLDWTENSRILLALAGTAMVAAVTNDEIPDYEAMTHVGKTLKMVYQMGHHLGEAMAMSILCAGMPDEMIELAKMKLKMAELGMFELDDEEEES